VGDGEKAEGLRREAAGCSWVTWHGAVSDMELSNISRQCLFGCYPGSAGLSVVHMMSLSLPVITHNDLSCHEGPEPSYIRDGVNGLLYDHNDSEQSLQQLLRTIAGHPDKIAIMQSASFEEYRLLTIPSYAERLWSLFSADTLPAGKALSVVES
jgi:glycosyltransferase involved in cell wall biosynthesis